MKSNPCKECGSIWHTRAFCNRLPRTPIKKIGKRGKKNAETTRKFKAQLKPTVGEYYVCYLQISPLCPKYLTIEQVTPEHVQSKSSRPDLRDDLSQIKPACSFCNTLKGSRKLENIPEYKKGVDGAI